MCLRISLRLWSRVPVRGSWLIQGDRAYYMGRPVRVVDTRWCGANHVVFAPTGRLFWLAKAQYRLYLSFRLTRLHLRNLLAIWGVRKAPSFTMVNELFTSRNAL